ncbi:MAG: M13 family metallopeptidase [Ruminococcus sp.]|nr:M13 family metallopeptidase [Ruminococcus sp.]
MNKKHRIISLFTAIAVMSGMLCGCTAENAKETSAEPTSANETFDVSAIRAQDDYYGYINAGRLLDTLPVYGEMTWGTFDEVDAQTVQEVLGLIGDIVSSTEQYEPGSAEYMIKTVYDQAMAFDDNAAVYSDIRSLCDEINSVGTIGELMELWKELYRSYGANIPFVPMVRQDYFESGKYALLIDQSKGMCGASYGDISDSDDDCIGMKNHIRDMLMSMGLDKEAADSKAKQAVYLALDIAHSTDFSAGKAANLFAAFEFVSEDELNGIFSNLDTSVIKLFFGLDENTYGGWYVKDRGQLERINELLTEENLEGWKTILISELVNANMEFLSTEADSLSAYGSSEEKEYSVCVNTIASNMFFYNDLSALYAEKNYTDDMDTAVREMCEQLRASYRELIGSADWLTEDGRRSLLKKLENMQFILPDSAVTENDPTRAELIKESYPETLRAIRERSYDDNIKNIGAEFDMTRPTMAMYEVNACYNPNNTVTVTAAMMHAPFFDPKADIGTNLGGLGAIIGHEMGHGFDTTCMDYNENGEYAPDWLSDADRMAFAERAEKMQGYFSDYTVLDIYHVDGKKTSGENYADLGSMECIVNILRDDKEQMKKYFENYAVIYAEMKVDSFAIDALETDEHSPESVRVNALLSSCDEFYELYDVKEGDGMYRAPEERVSRW